MWKTIRLVLIPKPGKSLFTISSFRPICVLITTSKLYEGMMRNKRLTEAIDHNEGLTEHKCGFRKGLQY